MKIPELREIIIKHSKEDLEYLLIELYKLIPKAKKEETDIDEIIKQDKPKEKAAKAKITAKEKSFETIKSEYETFISHAVNQHYLGKDRIIAKKDRPKWRFTCKAIIKVLFDVYKREPTYRMVCIQYLEQIYKILCTGGYYNYFSSEDTFASIGYEQEALCNDIIKLVYQSVDVELASAKIIEILLFESNHNNYYYPYRLQHFLPLLDSDKKINAMFEPAFAQLEEVDKKIERFWIEEQKKRYPEKYLPYSISKEKEHIVQLIFSLYFLLEEEDKAVDFYHKNYSDHKENKEIQLYVLVNWLISFEAFDRVIKEIDLAVEKGIAPRDSLVRAYKKIKDGERKIYL